MEAVSFTNMQKHSIMKQLTVADCIAFAGRCTTIVTMITNILPTIQTRAVLINHALVFRPVIEQHYQMLKLYNVYGR
jgi:hypothetical protein